MKAFIPDLRRLIEFLLRRLMNMLPFLEVLVLVPDEEEQECFEERERHEEEPIPCCEMEELVEDKE